MLKDSYIKTNTIIYIDYNFFVKFSNSKVLDSKIYTNAEFFGLMLHCLFTVSPLNQCDWNGNDGWKIDFAQIVFKLAVKQHTQSLFY